MTRITVAWSLLFAIVHFYWAAGGPLGMNGEPADEIGVQLYIGVIAVIGLAAAVVAHRGHVRLARIGGAALLVGVAAGTDALADGRRRRRRRRERRRDHALLPARRRAVHGRSGGGLLTYGVRVASGCP